ncbi:hypothetical protein JOF53_005942 [Crossiella equi]|uniref:Uncharacterized protein n=1 Tax=Crossiella equi TaxID=130796 RepID=A0ABS5AMZ6_9PSEU|nr:hypothetical protein [Crossiella equi]
MSSHATPAPAQLPTLTSPELPAAALLIGRAHTPARPVRSPATNPTPTGPPARRTYSLASWTPAHPAPPSTPRPSPGPPLDPEHSHPGSAPATRPTPAALPPSRTRPPAHPTPSPGPHPAPTPPPGEWPPADRDRTPTPQPPLATPAPPPQPTLVSAKPPPVRSHAPTHRRPLAPAMNRPRSAPSAKPLPRWAHTPVPRVPAPGSQSVLASAGTPAAGTCLHWGLRRGEDYLDPLSLFAPPRVRLLPWTDGRKRFAVPGRQKRERPIRNSPVSIRPRVVLLWESRRSRAPVGGGGRRRGPTRCFGLVRRGQRVSVGWVSRWAGRLRPVTTGLWSRFALLRDSFASLATGVVEGCPAGPQLLHAEVSPPGTPRPLDQEVSHTSCCGCSSAVPGAVTGRCLPRRGGHPSSPPRLWVLSGRQRPEPGERITPVPWRLVRPVRAESRLPSPALGGSGGAAPSSPRWPRGRQAPVPAPGGPR